MISRANQIRAKMQDAWNRVQSITSNAWNSIKSGVANGINGAVNFVCQIPGWAVAALGNFGSRLFSSGWAMIDGFRRGIVKSFNNAVNAVRSGLTRIRNFFPCSPAKVREGAHDLLRYGAH